MAEPGTDDWYDDNDIRRCCVWHIGAGTDWEWKMVSPVFSCRSLALGWINQQAHPHENYIIIPTSLEWDIMRKA